MAGTAVIIAITLAGARLLKYVTLPTRTRGGAVKYHLPQNIHPHAPRIKVFRGILYGSVSGILSAHSLLVAKSAVELLVRTIIDRNNQFNRWQSWVILLGLVAIALTQLYYMHCGLKLCSTSILYPYVFCIYNIIAILDGLVYFHQASQLSGLHAGLIALGTVVLLSGVLCLSWRLEEVTGHPPGVGAAQTPLTPAMGIFEDSPTAPTYSDFTYPPDEESHPRERQPLLYKPQHPHPRHHRHTLSHIRVSSAQRRTTDAGSEAAQIWAELDDDNETIYSHDQDALSALPPKSPYSPRLAHKRHRSKSSLSFATGNKPKHKSPLLGENDQQLPTSPSYADQSETSAPAAGIRSWDPRRLRFICRDVSRRTSAPVIAEPRPPQRRCENVSRGEEHSSDEPLKDNSGNSRI